MSKTLEPGVVYGDSYRELLNRCKEGGYALPAVNVVGTDSVNAVMEAAAKNGSDVMIQLSNGGAQFYAGQGMEDGFQAKVLGAVSCAQHVHMLARHYGICVVLHTDHANKKLIPWVDAMIDHGARHFETHGKPLFTSHMLDLSEETLEDNISECARVLERLVPLQMSLEIELGVTGGEEDGVGSDADLDDSANPKLYTQPDEVLEAYNRLSPIGHFSIAASFGNVHGVYKPGNVQLRPELLGEIQAGIASKYGTDAKPLDLVFHGGSGSTDEEIAEAVRNGVIKMNIDTDTQYAYTRSVAGSMFSGYDGVLKVDGEVGNKKAYDPRAWGKAAESAMAARVVSATQQLGSAGWSGK